MGNAGAVFSFLGSLGGIVSGVISGVVLLIVKAKFAEIAILRQDVQELRDKRVAQVEADLREIKDGGCNVGSQVLERVNNLLGWTKKMDGKIDRIAEETATQRAEISAGKQWTANLDASHQAHTRDRSIHSG